ncbi:MAG: transcriptional regulator with XRE-family HTH domain [Marivirga sp.]|jgi:transcriptional regulator with XRE-family HTH domain
MGLAENIRHLRSERGLSQTALAEALALKRGNISTYEKGLAQPSIPNLVNIARFFKVSLEMLATEDMTQPIVMQEENFIEKFSHSKLIKNIKDGVTALTYKPPKVERIEKLKKKNKDIAKMITGFKAFHEHRMDNFEMDKNTIESISLDYQNILKLLDTILKSNAELIEMIE